jgi:hypothetical protein
METILQAAIQIGHSFPATAFFRSDGRVEIKSHTGMTTLIEYYIGGISSMFDNEGFSLFEKNIEDKQDYQYGVPYLANEMPIFKNWLIQQQLIFPTFA